MPICEAISRPKVFNHKNGIQLIKIRKNHPFKMAVSPAPKTSAKKKSTTKTSAKSASSQSRFATSKLIQNLGSTSEGVQFSFVSDLRNAYGRD